MARQCYRGGCSEVATASCLFDPRASRAWLFPAVSDTETHAQAFLLCLDHADSLEVPVGWVLHDMREQNEAAESGTGGEVGNEIAVVGRTDSGAGVGDEVATDAAAAVGAEPTRAHNVIPIKSADQHPQEQEQEQEQLVIEDDMPLLQRAFRTVAPH